MGRNQKLGLVQPFSTFRADARGADRESAETSLMRLWGGGESHRRRLKYARHHASPLSMAVKAAATWLGTFVFNQHPSISLHKVLYRWRPTWSGAQHHVVGPGSMSVVSGASSTQLERPADVL